jgi:hypothetical protein
MTPKQISRWEKTRARGRTRFVLIRGVLLWGLLTAIFVTIVSAAMNGWHHWYVSAIIWLVIFPLFGGVVYGPLAWSSIETRYRRTVDE